MSSTPVAVFVSGGGRSLENLVVELEHGRLPITIPLVISDRPGIGALERAQRAGLESRVLAWRDFDGPDAFAAAAFDALAESGCELALLAGFLRLLRIPAPWLGRVLNIHPALLPAYGGKGYYGQRVHRAVLENGERETGCTVHFVDNDYDHGPIILQRRCPVRGDDTPETLAARVFEEEKIALPEAIRRVLSGAAQYVAG